MQNLLRRLRSSPRITLAVTVVLAVAAVFGHREVNDAVHAVREWMSPDVFRVFVAFLAAETVLVVGLASIRGLREGPAGALRHAYWWATLLLVAIGNRLLFGLEAEVIHFVQYALLAVPVLVLTGRVGTTVLLLTGIGAIDEAYQFLYLYPWAIPYDVNDVLADLLGAAVGVTFVMALAPGRVLAPGSVTSARRKRIWLPFLTVAAVILLAGPPLYWARLVAFYPQESTDGTLLLLSRQNPPASWWFQPHWGRAFLRLHPCTALAIGSVLIALYTLADYRLDYGSADAEPDAKDT